VKLRTETKMRRIARRCEVSLGFVIVMRELSVLAAEEKIEFKENW
jgi:hypothetical protein